MSTRFIVHVPVVIFVESQSELKMAWDALREHGGATYSADYQVEFRSERVKFKELRAAFDAKQPKHVAAGSTQARFGL